MRVISGVAKGRKLKAPRGLSTRPITDMIKEALFNVLGETIIDSRFLDLFAGSGSVGIEALSRQATQVVWVDNSLEAVKTIRENLRHCGWIENSQVRIYGNDVFQVLGVLQRNGELFDHIYVDPPFDQEGIFERFMKEIAAANLLHEKGILIIRTHKDRQLALQYERLKEYRCNKYGESSLHYYRLEEELLKC